MVPRRVAGVLVEVAGDEWVAYAPSSNTAHALNRAAGELFEAIDGVRSVDDLAEHLDVSAEVVGLGLDDLAEAGLVELDDAVPRTSRRDMLKKLGVGSAAAAALPVVETIVMPSALAAQSVVPPTPAPTDFPTPSPSPGTPAPTPGTPAPTPGTPAPTPGTPAPTPAPTPGTPAPTPGTPAPTPGPTPGCSCSMTLIRRPNPSNPSGDFVDIVATGVPGGCLELPLTLRRALGDGPAADATVVAAPAVGLFVLTPGGSVEGTVAVNKFASVTASLISGSTTLCSGVSPPSLFLD